MRLFKNTEFYKIGGDKTVMVSVSFDADPNASDEVLMRNAAEALKYYSETKVHKTWTRKIEVR